MDATMDTLFTRISSAAIVAVGLSVTALGAQTVITPPKNGYTPAQDVELGRQAAAQVGQQLPILHDEDVTSSIASLGRRLVDAIPQELQHAEFRYSFQVLAPSAKSMSRCAIRAADARSAARCSRSVSRLSTRTRGASNESVQPASGR